MNNLIKKEIFDLFENANVAIVSSVDADGFPNTKGMLALEHDGLPVHYFSTNYSAKRTKQFIDNPKACVYFFTEPDYRGLMLVGHIEVCTDQAHRIKLWREGFEMYYPQGVNDPDYCVFKFTAQRANYYHGLRNYDLDLSEF